MKRFDEIELRPEVHPAEASALKVDELAAASESHGRAASRLKRGLTLLTDLSLFAALALALATLIQTRGNWSLTLAEEWPEIVSLAGFLLIFSYFYFAGCWLIWGKTVGGAIFDVRVVSADGTPLDFERATKRWLASVLSLAAGGLGFVIAALPGGLSLPDRMSGSRSLEST